MAEPDDSPDRLPDDLNPYKIPETDAEQLVEARRQKAEMEWIPARPYMRVVAFGVESYGLAMLWSMIIATMLVEQNPDSIHGIEDLQIEGLALFYAAVTLISMFIHARTLGMWATGMRVVDRGGDEASALQLLQQPMVVLPTMFLGWLVWGVNGAAIAGGVMVIVDGGFMFIGDSGRTLHDRLARTKVLEEVKKKKRRRRRRTSSSRRVGSGTGRRRRRPPVAPPADDAPAD